MIPISDSIKSKKFPLFNLAIIGINLYVFFLMLTSPSIETFINTYALIPSLVNFTDPESLVPFVTSMFLHAGLLHIGSNMLFLWVFGDNIEAHFGKLWYLLIFFTSGIVGGLTQYLMSPESQIPMLGASGAVSGILGAYYVSHRHARIKSLVFIVFFVTVIQIPAAIYIVYWFGLQLLSGILELGNMSDTGGVAFWAHIGGFVAGVLLAKIGHKEYKEGVIEGEFEEVN
ncbi:MAG TPA: rhomboid family intramembrane serine protease [Candidatus Levybacteria bacterium]|nr:rhomboid family intramembrane serine protease [Candidatus Levybacteria bacterium]